MSLSSTVWSRSCRAAPTLWRPRLAGPAARDTPGCCNGEAQPEDDGAAQLSLFAEDELQAITEEGTTLAPGISTPRAAIPAAPQTTNTLVIDTPEALDVLARALASAPLFAFDTETDTTDEMTANLVGLSFAIGAGEAYYIPVGHTATPEGESPRANCRSRM